MRPGSGIRLHVFADYFEEAVFVDRLCEVSITARHGAPDLVESRIFAREHDHCSFCATFLGFDKLADLVAIDSWHHDIEKDTGVVFSAGESNRLFSCLGVIDFETKWCELYPHEFTHSHIVVADQDPAKWTI